MLSFERAGAIEREKMMVVTNVVVPLEIECLQEAAKQRGVSRTRLVKVVMEKVVRNELVFDILGDDTSVAEPPAVRYRRFRNR